MRCLKSPMESLNKMLKNGRVSLKICRLLRTARRSVEYCGTGSTSACHVEPSVVSGIYFIQVWCCSFVRSEEQAMPCSATCVVVMLSFSDVVLAYAMRFGIEICKPIERRVYSELWALVQTAAHAPSRKAKNRERPLVLMKKERTRVSVSQHK